jgi:hypothetical protein
MLLKLPNGKFESKIKGKIAYDKNNNDNNIARANQYYESNKKLTKNKKQSKTEELLLLDTNKTNQQPLLMPPANVQFQQPPTSNSDVRIEISNEQSKRTSKPTLNNGRPKSTNRTSSTHDKYSSEYPQYHQQQENPYDYEYEQKIYQYKINEDQNSNSYDNVYKRNENENSKKINVIIENEREAEFEMLNDTHFQKSQPSIDETNVWVDRKPNKKSLKGSLTESQARTRSKSEHQTLQERHIINQNESSKKQNLLYSGSMSKSGLQNINAKGADRQARSNSAEKRPTDKHLLITNGNSDNCSSSNSSNRCIRNNSYLNASHNLVIMPGNQGSKNQSKTKKLINGKLNNMNNGIVLKQNDLRPPSSLSNTSSLLSSNNNLILGNDIAKKHASNGKKRSKSNSSDQKEAQSLSAASSNTNGKSKNQSQQLQPNHLLKKQQEFQAQMIKERLNSIANNQKPSSVQQDYASYEITV